MRQILRITNSRALKSSTPGDYIAHVGNKVAAAQLLYGDNVAGALVDQAGIGGNFLEDLAREVAENSQLPDLGDLFVQKSRAAEATWPGQVGQAPVLYLPCTWPSSTGQVQARYRVQAPGWLTGDDTISATIGTRADRPAFEPIPIIDPSTTIQLSMF